MNKFAVSCIIAAFSLVLYFQFFNSPIQYLNDTCLYINEGEV